MARRTTQHRDGESGRGNGNGGNGGNGGNDNGDKRKRASRAPQKTHRCPICRKEFRYREVSDVPTFPFCSEACKVQDLGAWFDGSYQIHSSLITGEDTGGPDEDFSPPDESGESGESGDDAG